MATKKKRILNDQTIIDASFLQPIFGGDTTAPANDPNNIGHLHDGGPNWGSAAKIDLANHTQGRLVLQDAYTVSKTVSLPPSLVATPNDVVGGIISGDVYDKTSITNPVYPLTAPNTLTASIWYFTIPVDMDTTKPCYFTFTWTADILTTDGYDNLVLDPTKIDINNNPLAQTTNFRITWQWYNTGLALFPPAVMFDGYNTLGSLNGTNINPNALTRGRIPSLLIQDVPFKLFINDSSANNPNPNYVNLTGLSAATNAIMVGVQVDVLSCGFINIVGSVAQGGHINLIQGNFTYMSKTIGSTKTAFNTL